MVFVDRFVYWNFDFILKIFFINIWLIFFFDIEEVWEGKKGGGGDFIGVLYLFFCRLVF